MKLILQKASQKTIGYFFDLIFEEGRGRNFDETLLNIMYDLRLLLSHNLFFFKFVKLVRKKRKQQNVLKL